MKIYIIVDDQVVINRFWPWLAEDVILLLADVLVGRNGSEDHHHHTIHIGSDGMLS